MKTTIFNVLYSLVQNKFLIYISRLKVMKQTLQWRVMPIPMLVARLHCVFLQ